MDMKQISVSPEKDQQLFQEVLQTLPVPVQKGYLGFFNRHEQNQFRLSFCWDNIHKAFQHDSGYALIDELLIHNTVPDSSELRLEITRKMIRGKMPLQYIVSMSGYGKEFAFDDLKREFIDPLAVREYQISRADLLLELEQLGAGSYAAAKGLSLSPGLVSMYGPQMSPPLLLEWFERLHTHYDVGQKH